VPANAADDVEGGTEAETRPDATPPKWYQTDQPSGPATAWHAAEPVATPPRAPTREGVVAPPPRASKWHGHRAALVGIGAALLLLAVGAFALMQIGGSETREGGVALSLPDPDRVRLERSLSSQDSKQFTAALDPAVRAAPGVTQAMLPAGSEVIIDSSSFTADPFGLATVDARVTGPRPGAWRLLLRHADGNWLLLSTEVRT
jgi:hypothetical protein